MLNKEPIQRYLTYSATKLYTCLSNVFFGNVFNMKLLYYQEGNTIDIALI